MLHPLLTLLQSLSPPVKSGVEAPGSLQAHSCSHGMDAQTAMASYAHGFGTWPQSPRI